MEINPVIYVLAGPNGVGKTTVNSFFIPGGVPYINADDIAKQLRERLGNINIQEIANEQALDRMNGFIARRQSFAIETNLSDHDTWKFLIGVRGLGYAIHLNFFCVSNVEICIERVLNRVLQGGHFVKPEIVKSRYESGLILLRHYRDIPDQLVLTDNTLQIRICSELKLGVILKRLDSLPEWVIFVLSDISGDRADGFDSLADVRNKYRNLNDDK